MEKLVSTEWLAARLDAEDIVILDASMHLPGSGRDAAAEYREGHIPGARFLDLASFIDSGSPVPKALPTAAQFAERMNELGITPGSRIVLYDDSAIKSSARAWFILDLFGEDKVAILDGGLAKWKGEGRETSQRELDHAPRRREVPRARREVKTKDELLDNISRPPWQIVDARDEARFEGQEGSGSQGHIPGSRNLHFTRLFNEDGTYKTPEGIRREFEDAGVDLNKPVVTSCNSGMTASVLLFGLELLGTKDAALYDGSWMEWGADPDTPKQSGEAD